MENKRKLKVKSQSEKVYQVKNVEFGLRNKKSNEYAQQKGRAIAGSAPKLQIAFLIDLMMAFS